MIDACVPLWMAALTVFVIVGSLTKHRRVCQAAYVLMVATLAWRLVTALPASS
jgi:predicted metal-binding membrane protein